MTSPRIQSATPRKILVVSGNPDVREGWARYFEARGLDVIRCAGPEATHCALERGAHCPLLDEVDAAYYDNACVTPELAADLVKRPRLLPIFIANGRTSKDATSPRSAARSDHDGSPSAR